MFTGTSITKLFCVSAFASAVLGQGVLIQRPQPDTWVTAGDAITVQLAKPMAATGSEEVSIVIGAFDCSQDGCPGASKALGEVLYSGPYNPELHPDNNNPYENFTVNVPSWYNGTMQLGVAHFYLLGASSDPQLQSIEIALDVDPSYN